MSVSRTLLCTVALCAACETGPGPRSERAGAPEIREQPVTEADSLYRSGEFTAARQIWTDQLASAWNRGDSAQAARLLTSLGLVARQLGDYAESRQVGLEALDLKTRLGLREDLFRSYNALGLLAWTRGDLDEASTMFDRASAAAAEVGDDLSVAKAAANMAHVHNERGEPYRARDGFMALARASRAAGDMVTLGRTLINLAMLDIRLGDPLSAASMLEEARSLAAAAGASKPRRTPSASWPQRCRPWGSRSGPSRRSTRRRAWPRRTVFDGRWRRTGNCSGISSPRRGTIAGRSRITLVRSS